MNYPESEDFNSNPLVTKVPLGHALVREAPASRDRRQGVDEAELRRQVRSEAGASEREASEGLIRPASFQK